MMRPALRYYGSKWQLAPWIVRHFPAHKHYVELCGGGAAVLLRKSPSKLETLNDVDGDVVNFFRVLRDSADDLIERLRLTPYARAEYLAAWDSAEVEPVERARRFFVRCWQGMNGVTLAQRKGWKVQLAADGRGTPAPLDVAGVVDGLWWVADRLRLVQIEQAPAMALVGRVDAAETLFYYDPPYLPDTRANPASYAHEMTADDHRTAAERLRLVAGFVVVSGYDSADYRAWFNDYGWGQVTRRARTNGRPRVESLWLCPRTWAALRQGARYEQETGCQPALL